MGWGGGGGRGSGLGVFTKKNWVGGGLVGGGGQGRYERRIEVFVKVQKKWGGGEGVGGRVWENSPKKIGWGGGRVGGEVGLGGGGSGWM